MVRADTELFVSFYTLFTSHTVTSIFVYSNENLYSHKQFRVLLLKEDLNVCKLLLLVMVFSFSLHEALRGIKFLIPT